VGFITTLINLNVIKPFFKGYWAFLEPKFVEEVGEGKLTPPLFNQGHFEAKGQLLRAISEQRC
jgi:hypothetical protein